MPASPARFHSPLWRRIARGVEGLLAPFQHVDDSLAAQALSPAGLALFRNMSTADRAHSLRVYQWLLEQGYEQPDLLTAGLLHDCGKAAATLSVWQRTLKVLLKRLAPAWWQRLSQPVAPGHWRYPFYVLAVHPQIGAEWAAEAGCSQLTCWLIANHEKAIPTQHPHAPLLTALQRADAVS